MGNRRNRAHNVINWKLLKIIIVVGLLLVVPTIGGLFIAGILRLPESQASPNSDSVLDSKESKKSKSLALNELRAKISSLDPDGTIVSSVREGDSEAWAVIEVTSQWHYTPKGARLELARAFQRAWASYTNNGNALIEIKDGSGNKIGGTTFTGSVYVDD